MKQKRLFSRLLRVVAACVESLSESQIEQLVQGKAKLSIIPIEQKQQPEILSGKDCSALAERLSYCTEREQARAILSEIPNRESLAAFAKSQSVHVMKQDRRDDIETKIIEFVVGAKLRSAAIQSLNMKGGTEQNEG